MIIYLSNGNGDIVMATPSLKLLAKSHNLLVILKYPFQKEILQNAGIECDILYLPSRSVASIAKLYIAIFKMWLKDRSRAFYAPMMPESTFSSIFLKLLPCKTVVSNGMGWPKGMQMSDLSDLHQVREVAAFFARAGKLSLTTNINELEYRDVTVNSTTSKTIAIGITCGAAEKHKIPTPAKFAHLINFIHKKDPEYKFLVPFLSSERAWFEELKDSVEDSSCLVSIVDEPFDKLVEALSKCRFGISGTTGHGHIFAYVGLPVVCFSGVADYAKSGPFTKKIYPVELNLPCAPCYQNSFGLGCGRKDCMEMIDLTIAEQHIETLI
ncbi:glycosyltransferase family 9 protein [Enterovibrio norvegicus]|uniref:glycosyltransferase family 9 protein n=1 Tax=Enterovibrio norvegicus TaxID=188144 RepID=UPI000C837BBA|nr:hypothetical protein [Enterovibrio norvegicus]PMH72478.1 hypothetical protein BCU62_02365 [Enterovibrio norvegicus]